MDSRLVLAVSLGYLAILFAIAWRGDRAWQDKAFKDRRQPLLYALSLAVYCTSWTFYGAIGRAATAGFDFLSIYAGPILMLALGWPILAKMVRVAKAENVVSISDFISARYGKSRGLAALVTVAAVVGVLPYFALQLKAITISLEALTGGALASRGDGGPGHTTLVVTAAMAVFVVLFGVRNIHANEHHRGLMQAIATESLVKLAAALLVGGIIAVLLSGGPGRLADAVAADPHLRDLLRPDLDSGWWAMTLLAALAIICLPRQFHVMVVENTNVADIRTAAWLFPAYLLAINIFVLPVALTGLLLFPEGGVSADSFLVTVPMHQGWPWLALVAFIGGLSAATSMIIVGAVALSTMVCNDLVVPLLMQWKPASRRWQTNPKPMLLAVRQVAVLALLALAYLCYLLIGTVFPLATIGTVSFAAVAQFAPALLVGLVNRRVTRAGAFAGITAGFLAWAWTVLIPSFSAAGLLPPDALDGKLFGLTWSGPAGLGGIHDLDTLAYGALISLAINLGLLVVVSALTSQSELERLQARRFVSMRHDMRDGTRPQRGATLADLHELATRYVGRARADLAFQELAALRGGIGGFESALLVRIDDEAIRATEWLLSGAIGSASARVVVAGLLTDRRLSRSDARSIIGDASRAILDQHLLLRTTLEHVGKGICAWDRDFRTLVWNHRFLELLDVPEGLMQVGMPLSDLVEYLRGRGEYGRNGEMETLLARRSDPHRQAVSDLYHRVRPDGTVLEISTDPLPEGGFVAVYTDVTERHRAAQALREANEGLERRIAERTQALAAAKAEADRATQAKTRLLAAVSHDLLQPLHAARLFISAAMERTADPLIPQADAALRSVEQLLGDLLDVTKLDTGVIKPKRTGIRVEEVLRPLAEEVAILAGRHGMVLRHVPCGLSVETDPILLRRILQNFLANAVRYAGRGRILLGCRRAGGNLRVEVWDTGPGIPADKLREIFQEFRQLNPGSQQQGHSRDKGLGLGLSIVDRLAAILGHRVTVRSVVGKGSCFAVEVPLAAAAAPARLAAAGARTEGLEGTLVLCIENEAAIAAATRELLSGWSCEVVTAADAEEALAALGGRRPDVVLTDFHLDQGLSGLDVLARIRAEFGPDIPAAAITADRSPAVRDAVMAANCRLTYKPIRPGALRALLGHLAAEGRRGQAA